MAGLNPAIHEGEFTTETRRTQRRREDLPQRALREDAESADQDIFAAQSAANIRTLRPQRLPSALSA
jgi:hypothetical protein